MRNKKLLCSLLCLALLTGCSADWFVGDGRGDWTIDLCAGYSINKINSNQILVGYRKRPDAPGHIVISNYYVTAYQIQGSYICLQGIRTQVSCITEEERTGGRLCYYLIDTVSGETYGPYLSYQEYTEYCAMIPLELGQEWNYTSEYSRK